MRLHLQNLAFLAAILVAPFPSLALADASAADLLASGKAARSQGNNAEALSLFDQAVKLEPSNYMILFQRGVTYLSLSRNSQAKSDFDGVLKLRPGFEGALTQRARIHARNAEWTAARVDYKQVGKKAEADLAILEEAEGAAILAAEAEKRGDYEACINNAGTAIMVAGTSLGLRQLRARCRFERGEVQEGISDLQHALQIHPGNLEPYVQISSMLFYSLADMDRGLSQVKKCLQSDPDYKACKTLHREQKSIVKSVDKLNTLTDRKQYASATRILLGISTEDDPGLLAEVKHNAASARDSGFIHAKAESGLYMYLLETLCECYVNMNSHKKAAPFCKEVLEHNPFSEYGLLHQAHIQLEAENYDAAVATLSTAKEHHQGSRLIQEKLQEAQVQLKRSKTKDYYKVLGVSKEADEATIKKAYRKATKEFHPDKAVAKGMSKEDAEKKMASINEAYEVLSDPELKARFDQGDDPNDPSSQQGGNPFHGSPFGGGQQQFVFRQGGQQFHFGGGGSPFGGGFPFG